MILPSPKLPVGNYRQLSGTNLITSNKRDACSVVLDAWSLVV